MRYLGPYDVLAVAARVLRCSSADAVLRTDLNAVERVLDSVRLTSGLAESAGVMLAGLVYGLLEALVTAFFGSTYTQIVVFSVVIGALTLMPNGLLGRAAVNKV